jgi:tRNA(fMet)-specific endonuclease VapC
MIAFDTDVLVEILLGSARFVQRAAAVPASQQFIPVVAVEEIIRGRLHAIRQAEAGRTRLTIARAYELFTQSLADLQRVALLPYTPAADAMFQELRARKVRVSTHDLRIAVIAMDHGATLVSRNRRDFDRVPGLAVEYWD